MLTSENDELRECTFITGGGGGEKYWSIFSFLTWPSPSFQKIIDDPAKILGGNRMTLPYFLGMC